MTDTDDDGRRQAPATGKAPTSLHRWFRDRFGNPSAVYGLIVFSTLMAGVSDQYSETWQVLAESVASLLIFFIAHVFAHTLAEHGELPLGAAIGSAVRHSAGMLYSAVPSVTVLLTGMLEGADPEWLVSLALLVAMLVLFILGYSAYAERGARRTMRWIGAFGTAALGFVIFLLDLATHSGSH